MNFWDGINVYNFVLPILMPTVLLAAFIACVVMQIVRTVRHVSNNAASPVLTVPAKVTGRREEVIQGVDDTAYERRTIRYYATFEFESGSRMEFRLTEEAFGLLLEGDKGRLTFQGTWYKGFERVRESV